MDDTEDRYHEEAGAEVLSAFFPSVITDCVRYHVPPNAICARPSLTISSACQKPLSFPEPSGWPMNDDEVTEFEKNPNLKKIIQVRYLDEAGKQADMETPISGILRQWFSGSLTNTWHKNTRQNSTPPNHQQKHSNVPENLPDHYRRFAQRHGGGRVRISDGRSRGWCSPSLADAKLPANDLGTAI